MAEYRPLFQAKQVFLARSRDAQYYRFYRDSWMQEMKAEEPLVSLFFEVLEDTDTPRREKAERILREFIIETHVLTQILDLKISSAARFLPAEERKHLGAASGHRDQDAVERGDTQSIRRTYFNQRHFERARFQNGNVPYMDLANLSRRHPLDQFLLAWFWRLSQDAFPPHESDLLVAAVIEKVGIPKKTSAAFQMLLKRFVFESRAIVQTLDFKLTLIADRFLEEKQKELGLESGPHPYWVALTHASSYELLRLMRETSAWEAESFRQGIAETIS